MKVPFWATREFRWLVIIGVMTLSTLAVLAFEILPLLSVRAPEPAVPDVLSEDLLKLPPELKASLEGAVDSTSISLFDPAYRSLVLHVSTLPAGEISKEAVPIPYRLLGKDPAKLRGRPVRIEAMFLETHPTALNERIDGIEYVYRTFLLDPGSSVGDGYVLDLLERPPDLAMRTPVAVDGLFLRIGEYETGTRTVKAPFLVGRELQVVERKAQPHLDTTPLMIAVCGLAAAAVVISILFHRQANARRLARLAGAARPVLAPGPGRPRFPAKYSRAHVEWKPPPRVKFRGPLRRAIGRGDFLRVTGRQRTLIRVAVLGAALVCMALLAFNYYTRRIARERSPSLDRGAQFLAAFREADEAWKAIHGAQEKAWLEEKALSREDLALIRQKLKVLEKSAVAVEDLHYIRREDGDDLHGRHLRLRLWILDATELTAKRPDGEAKTPEGAGFYIPFERALRRGREARRALEALAGERTAPPDSPGAEPPAGGPVSPGTSPRGLPEIRESLARARAELLRLEGLVIMGLNQDGLTARDLPELGILREESGLLAEDIQRAEALEARPPTEK